MNEGIFTRYHPQTIPQGPEVSGELNRPEAFDCPSFSLEDNLMDELELPEMRRLTNGTSQSLSPFSHVSDPHFTGGNIPSLITVHAVNH
ncbi:Hypothetical protein NTJ_08118 [Nesidiocoris tenuis]|uniref:Uncharacterized protein n=1 Tax=Nesidiocoris tenuis TaxID=355587 RepID=A0ABN7AVI2_9HEMI|nr:Hypothetical protein NTJ_08118 [Nesidiocoris tenuis]